MKYYWNCNDWRQNYLLAFIIKNNWALGLCYGQVSTNQSVVYFDYLVDDAAQNYPIMCTSGEMDDQDKPETNENIQMQSSNQY